MQGSPPRSPRIGRGGGDRVLVPKERAERGRSFAELRGDLAPLVLRLFLGVVLVHLAWGPVMDGGRLEVYAERIEAAGIASQAMNVARVSVFLQLAAGILLAAGLMTRLFAFLVGVHFIGAIVLLHVGTPLAAWVGPLALVAVSLALWLSGPGPYAVSALLVRR